VPGSDALPLHSAAADAGRGVDLISKQLAADADADATLDTACAESLRSFTDKPDP